MPTSRRAPAKPAKPSMVRKAATPGSRTAYDFNCPMTNCTWTGSLGKVGAADPSMSDQQAADDALVCLMLAVEHLRGTHTAMLPSERAAVASGPPAGGGGAS